MIKEILAKVLNLSIAITFTITNTLWAAPVDTTVILQDHLRPSSVGVFEGRPPIVAALKSSSSGNRPIKPDVVIPEHLHGKLYNIYNTQLDLAEQALKQGKKEQAQRILKQARDLLEFHFFETELPTFEAMRNFAQKAHYVEDVNIRRPMELKSPPTTDPTGRRGPIDIMNMEERRLHELRERGSRIPASFGSSAGGLSTRTKGEMRAGFVFAIPELNSDNPDQLYGFVQLKIAEAKRSQEELREATKDKSARVKVYFMGSGETGEMIKEILERNDHYGYNRNDIEIFEQGIQIRFTPSETILIHYLEQKEEDYRQEKISEEELEALRRGIAIQRQHIGKPLRLSDGRLVTNPPGHWDFVRWLILNGILAKLKRDNINFVMNAHMNNTAGRLSAELKGLLAEQIEEAREDGRPVPVALVGVAENRNERGGLLLTAIDKETGESKMVIADKNDMTEEFKRHVSELDKDQLRTHFPYFHTGSILFSIDGLMETFELPDNYDKELTIEEITEQVTKKEPHAFINLKEEKDVDEHGRPVIYVGAQIERNISGFTFNLPYIPVIIDRYRSFVPIKTIEETDPTTITGRSRLREAADALRDKLAYLFDDIEYTDNVRRISNVASGLLRDDKTKVSNKAFADNVPENRKAIKRFLLEKANAPLLQVVLGIRPAAIQDDIKMIFNDEDEPTDFGKDFLYFLRVIGYKTGKKVNIKRIETPEGVNYYIYDEDILRYHGYINGYAPDYLNLTSALEDYLIVSDVAGGKGVFYELAAEDLPKYMKKFAETALDESRRLIKKGATMARARDITLGPLWIPSYRRPSALYRVLERQTEVLDEFGHRNIPIAVTSNVLTKGPGAKAEPMKDEEVEWVNKTLFGGKKTPKDIRAMKWGELDRMVIETFKKRGFNITYVDWDVRDNIVKKVIDTLTERYTDLWRQDKLREDILRQFKDVDSIRPQLERILADQFASNISGIRNFTIMLAMGLRMASVDDDSLPVMRVAKRKVLDDILEKRRQEVKDMRKKFFKELHTAAKQKIKSESDFVAYLRTHPTLSKKVTDVIRIYYGYSSPEEKETTALIPEKAGQIVQKNVDNTTRFNALLDTGLPERVVVSEDAILAHVDNKPEDKEKKFPEYHTYEYDRYTVDYLGVLDRALGAFAVNPNTGAMIVDKDKRGFAGSVFTGNVDEIRFLRNQCATTHFNHDRDKSADAQIDSFLERGAIDSDMLQEAALKVLYLARPEAVTALLDPQEDTTLSKRIFMCMNMFSFDDSVFPIPTIGQLYRREEPYFNYLVRVVTGRLMTWTRTVGGHHRLKTATRPNIPLQVRKEHSAMADWHILNRVVRRTLDRFEAMEKYDDRVDYKERMRYLGKEMIEEGKIYEIPDKRKEALHNLQARTIERINTLTKKAAAALKHGNKELHDSLNILAGEFVVEFLPPRTGVEKVEGTKITKHPVETTYRMEVDQTGAIIRLKPVIIIEDLVGDVKQKEDRVVYFEIDDSRPPHTVKRSDIKTTKMPAKHGDAVKQETRYSITLADGTEIVFDEMPEPNERRYMSGINDSTKDAFIEKVEKDVRKQMQSDGETLLFWPDVMDVARTTDEFKGVRQRIERSEVASAADTMVKASSAGEEGVVEKLTLCNKMGEKTFIIIGPIHGSEKLLLAEDEQSGQLFVIKKLETEGMERQADEIYEFLRRVPEDYPHIYRPVVMSAGKDKWAGLEDAKAIVYPYAEGVPFGEKFEGINEGAMGYRGIELIDTVINITDVASYLQGKDVPGTWNINTRNILIKPDGSPFLIDYSVMRVDPIGELEYLIYGLFTRPGYGEIENIIQKMKFVNATDLNKLIQSRFLALHYKVKDTKGGFSSIAEFKKELTELRNFLAKSVLRDLIRDGANYEKNKDTIRRLTLDILGIKDSAEFKLQRPVRVIVAAAGLGTRMTDKKSKVLQKVCGEPIIYHVLRQTAFLDKKPVVVVRSEQWRDALGKEGKGGNFAEIKEALDKGGFDAEYVFEDYIKGDGHAVLSAKENLAQFDGDLLVVWGDMAVLNPETVLWLTMIHQALGDVSFSIATTYKKDPYAPIMVDKNGRVIGSKKGAKLDFGCDDVGLFMGKAKDIFSTLEKFPKDSAGDFLNPYDSSANKKGEINFVQISAILAQNGTLSVIAPALADIREFQGVNDDNELSMAETYRKQMMFERNSQMPAVVLAKITPDAKITEEDERKIAIRFKTMAESLINATEKWEMAGWSMQYVQLAPGAKLALDHTRGENYVNVITGKLSNINRDAFAPAKQLRNTRVTEEYIEAGEKGAIVAIMVDTTPDAVVTEMSQTDITTGSRADLLNWVNCNTYGWGEHFDNLAFYNLKGIEIINGEEKKVCYIQFWTAGQGVNCADHDHSELTKDTTFGEIHFCMRNGTGKGGMVYYNESGKPAYLPLPRGHAHGPFWGFDPETGKPVTTAGGVVAYGQHRWEGGGSFIELGKPNRYDLWAVFELVPEVAIIPVAGKSSSAGKIVRIGDVGIKVEDITRENLANNGLVFAHIKENFPFDNFEKLSREARSVGDISLNERMIQSMFEHTPFEITGCFRMPGIDNAYISFLKAELSGFADIQILMRIKGRRSLEAYIAHLTKEQMERIKDKPALAHNIAAQNVLERNIRLMAQIQESTKSSSAGAKEQKSVTEIFSSLLKTLHAINYIPEIPSAGDYTFRNMGANTRWSSVKIKQGKLIFLKSGIDTSAVIFGPGSLYMETDKPGFKIGHKWWEYKGDNPLVDVRIDKKGSIYAIVKQEVIAQLTEDWKSDYAAKYLPPSEDLPLTLVSELDTAAISKLLPKPISTSKSSSSGVILAGEEVKVIEPEILVRLALDIPMNDVRASRLLLLYNVLIGFKKQVSKLGYDQQFIKDAKLGQKGLLLLQCDDFNITLLSLKETEGAYILLYQVRDLQNMLEGFMPVAALVQKIGDKSAEAGIAILTGKQIVELQKQNLVAGPAPRKELLKRLPDAEKILVRRAGAKYTKAEKAYAKKVQAFAMDDMMVGREKSSDKPNKSSSAGNRALAELNRGLLNAENILLDALVKETTQVPGEVELLNDSLLTESLQKLTQLSAKATRLKVETTLTSAEEELIQLKIATQRSVIEFARVCAPIARIESEGTIIVDANAIPDIKQRMAVISMLKDHRLRDALEYALSFKDKGQVTKKTQIVLLADVNRQTLNRKKTILISDKQQLADVKLFKIGVKKDDILLPMAELIAVARGLLSLNEDNFNQLFPAIKKMYQQYTQNTIEAIVEQALREGTWSVFELIITTLPGVEKLSQEEIERLQRQAWAALIAA